MLSIPSGKYLQYFTLMLLQSTIKIQSEKHNDNMIYIFGVELFAMHVNDSPVTFYKSAFKIKYIIHKILKNRIYLIFYWGIECFSRSPTILRGSKDDEVLRE